jgi:hypothetical protein
VHDLELLFRGVQYDDVCSVIIPENLEVVVPRHHETGWNPLPLASNVTLNQAMLPDVIVDCHFHPASYLNRKLRRKDNAIAASAAP